MKTLNALAIALGVSLVPVAAQAQETAAPAAAAATTVKEGAVVFSADGRRVGRIDRVKMENGAPASVSIIYAGHFVYIPVSTLTASERGFTSTLTKADINKL